MRVVVFVKSTEKAEQGMTRDPETMKMLEEMGKYNDELRKAGILKMAEGSSRRQRRSAWRSTDRTAM